MPKVESRPASLFVSLLGFVALASDGFAQVRVAQTPQPPASAGTITRVTRTAFAPVACQPPGPGTCPPGSTLVTPVPTDTDCFGCPLGTQFSEWRSEPTTNPPLPANAPRLRVDKYVPNPLFCERVIQVDITARGDALGTLRVENRDPLNGCTAILNLQVDMVLTAVGVPGFPSIPVNLLTSQAQALGPFDNVTDFGGTSGFTLNVPPVSQSACNRFLSPADIAFFVDSTPGNPNDNFVEFSHSAVDNSGVNGCAPVTFQSDPFASLQIEVVYTVCRLSPPDAVNDTATTCKGSPVTICAFANDTTDTPFVCPNPGTTTGLTGVPAGWTATWVSQPSCTTGPCTGIGLQITPPATFTGQTTFNYTVTDTDGCTDTATVTVNVLTPPDAVNDSASTCKGANATINVFANDTSDTALACPAAGSQTGLSAVSPAGAGTVSWINGTCANTLCNNRCVQFVPSATFTGAATFTYTITDTDGCTDTATVTVNVLTPPAPVNDSASTCQGATATINVLANDTSDTPLNCPAAGSTTGLGTVAPAGAGTVSWINGTCANTLCNNRCVQFVPSAAFTGAATFTYTITDTDGCSASATVTVNVLTPPNAVNDSATVCKGATATINAFANDTSDTALNCPAAGSTTGLGTVSPAGAGTASWVNGSCANALCNNRCLQFVPSASFTGTATFTYTITDTDGCTDSATVTVNVLTPPDAVNDTASTCKGATVLICAFGNDTSDTALTCPAAGSTTGLGAVSPAGAGTVTWTSGACANTLCNNLGLTFVPSATFTGAATFTYTITDTDGCTDTATVTVNVQTPPDAVNDSASTCKGATATLNVFANDTSDTALTCPAAGSQTGLSAVSPAGAGTVSWVNGTCANTLCNNRCVSFVPSATFTGAATFTYTITDTDGCTDTATVTVNVLTPPDAVNDTASTCKGAAVPVNVFANDTSDTPLTCPAAGSTTGLGAVSPAGAGTVTWINGTCANTLCNNRCVNFVPSATFTGTATFTYTITDTDGCTDTATVTVNVLTPPAPVNDSASTCRNTPADINVLGNDTSDTALTCPAPGSTTGLGAVSPAGAGTVSWVTGSCTNTLCNGLCLRFVPSATFVGSASFSYTLTDTDNCSASATVTVNVCQTDAVNDSVTLCIGDTFDLNVTGNDSTTCGSLLCPIVIGAIPPNILVEPVNCGGPSCSTCRLRITALSLPAGNPPFTVSFNYTVTSSPAPGCSDTATVTVTLQPNCTLAALPPVIKAPGDVTPIPIEVLAGADPGPGCGPLDLASLVVTSGPTQGTAIVDHVTGRITYTPFPTFVGSDTFCYQIENGCGCLCQSCITIRDAAPCPTATRNECGSLLLFPEYDNYGGSKTLVTITDGCCLGSTTSTRIEVIFINKANCLETNRTFTLTPCDTLSFVTSAVASPNTSGYLYAFAKNNVPSLNNPNGTPIVHNHLIGQEMVMNGITTFAYSVNAASFKGIGNEGDPNDDDQDGIRDLNGLPDAALPEYEGAPDQILIPRFLGQDASPTSGFISDLILINLSGGAAFTTIVNATIFNDDELAFSAQHSFYCWEKLPLWQFSQMTLQTVLANSQNNPNEILGFNRESGWMILDGYLATSSAEAINNPAIYAVLVERAGGFHAADLPFELCLQDNGDLLPHSLFGDGPTPQAGDDQ